MTPQEIFANVTAAYSRVASYRDRGVVLVRLTEAAPGEILFRTWFARPRQFRFDFRLHHPYPPLRHIVTNCSVRCAGETATHWCDRPAGEETRPLEIAIAGATGISHGSAHTISNLLMPDVVRGTRLNDLERAQYQGSELFEGVQCHVVSGYYMDDMACRAWVGESDWLVRKVWSDLGLGASEEIHRDIAVNDDIPVNTFVAGGSLLDAD